MAGFFRCPRHGRFPISEVITGVSARKLFEMTAALDYVDCPRCKRRSLKCRVKRQPKVYA